MFLRAFRSVKIRGGGDSGLPFTLTKPCTRAMFGDERAREWELERERENRTVRKRER